MVAFPEEGQCFRQMPVHFQGVMFSQEPESRDRSNKDFILLRNGSCQRLLIVVEKTQSTFMSCHGSCHCVINERGAHEVETEM